MMEQTREKELEGDLWKEEVGEDWLLVIISSSGPGDMEWSYGNQA